MAKKHPLRDFIWRHSAGLALVVMLVFVATIGFVGYTYVRVTRTFDSSRQWDLPSRVYSDATPLVPGLKYSRALLEPKLNHVGYRETELRVAQPGEYRFVDGGLEIYLQPFDYPDVEFHGVPIRVEMDESAIRRVVRLDDGATLRGARIEPELITSLYDDVMEDRVPVSLQSVPQDLVDAIVAAEDRAYFSHEGISLRGIARAAWHDVQRRQVRSGGSTLTQQLVKNLFLTPERKFRRKALEALMAVILEARYDKKEILEAYLNEIYLGQSGAVQIVGVEQASRVYFGKHVKYLTLDEAATLAGTIPSPNAYSPLRHPKRALDRRNLVLAQMRELGMITEEEYEKARTAALSVNRFPRAINSAPWFVDLVLKQLRETYPETQLRTEGLRIYTTLDTMMQRSAETALVSGLDNLAKKYRHVRNSKTPVEGAFITIQPGTGYVKALVGGRDYAKSQFNRAYQARRQPGSLFKPFVYAAAMDSQRGADALTAATILDDSPISIPSPGGVWKPQNYDGTYHGFVTVRRALAQSYNIPAVRAAIDAGMPNVIKMASRIGVESKLQPFPSVSLGSFEVTPLEIAYAYSVFANEGVKAEPITILAVAKSDGALLENREVTMQRVAPASVTYVVNDILKDVLTYGTASRVRTLGFRAPFAGKTGTTNNYRDAWFVGYSPQILSLVWVGYDDGHTLRLAGGEAAVPIWTEHMKRIVGLMPSSDFQKPDDIVEWEIDETTGLLATPNCPDTRVEVFVAGTEPTALCDLHAVADDLPWRPFGIGRGDSAEIGDGTASGDARPSDQPSPKKPKKKKRGFWDWIFD
jgi:penicillin-binding protein 1B